MRIACEKQLLLHLWESCYIWGPIEYEKDTNPDTMADSHQPKKKFSKKKNQSSSHNFV